MVCLGFKPRAAGWKAQTDPLSYGGTPKGKNLNPTKEELLSKELLNLISRNNFLNLKS